MKVILFDLLVSLFKDILNNQDLRTSPAATFGHEPTKSLMNLVNTAEVISLLGETVFWIAACGPGSLTEAVD
jgi:hypothetical protein